jgi:chaperonin GroES
MDSLGAKGRLLKLSSGQFSYTRTDQALWAITWTDNDQYILGMDLRTLRARLLLIASRSTGTDADVKVEVADPNGMIGTDVLTRRSLSPWLPGWSMVVRPRYPAALALRQEEQVDRGRGIIMLSVLMIGIGALVSARLLQRELDAAAEKADQGVVLAVGPGKRNDKDELIALDVAVNDQVLFGKFAGQTIKIDGEELLVLKEDDILAIINQGE